MFNIEKLTQIYIIIKNNFRILLMNDKNIKIDREFDLGYQAYQNKKYKEVIKHFSKVIKLDNNNSADIIIEV